MIMKDDDPNIVDRNLITLLRWSGAVLASSSVLLLTDSRGSTLLNISFIISYHLSFIIKQDAMVL